MIGYKGNWIRFVSIDAFCINAGMELLDEF